MNLTGDCRADVTRWLKARLVDLAESRRVRRQGDHDCAPPTAANALFDSLCEEAQDWLTEPNRKPPAEPCPVFTLAVHKWVNTLD